MDSAYDFSFSPPTAQQVLAAGGVGVIGYVSRDPRKNWTLPTYQEFGQLGLGRAVVHENTVDYHSWDWHLANQQCDLLRFPISRPIFYAVDESVPVTAYPDVALLLSKQLGRPRGIYGGKGLCHFCLDKGVAVIAWATNATSFDNGDHSQARIALQQLYGQSSVPGTDRNLVLSSDWGQDNYRGGPPVATKIGTMYRDPRTTGPTAGWIIYVEEHSSLGTHLAPESVDAYKFFGAEGPIDCSNPDGSFNAGLWGMFSIFSAGPV